jgi:hypothetical protein
MSSPYPNLSPEGERLFDPPGQPIADQTIAELRDHFKKCSHDAEVVWQQQLAEKNAEIVELKAWKESALKVMPDFQVIWKLMGLPLGTDVSSQIVPWMTQSKQQIAAMAAMLDEIMATLDGTMATFAAYLNVPESRELRDRWMKLKSELAVQKLYNQVGP